MVRRMNADSNILTGKIIIGISVPGFARMMALFSVMYIQENNITVIKPTKGTYKYGIVTPSIMKSLNSKPLLTKYCIRNNSIRIVEVSKTNIDDNEEADVHLKIIRLGTMLNESISSYIFLAFFLCSFPLSSDLTNKPIDS